MSPPMRPLNNPFLGEKGRAAFRADLEKEPQLQRERQIEREPIVVMYLLVMLPNPGVRTVS